MRELAYTSTEGMASSRRWLVGSMLALMALGTVVSYSARVVLDLRDAPGTGDLVFLQAHLGKVLLALTGFVLATRLGPRALFGAARPVWIGAVALLLAVLVVGEEWNGARRWLSLGGVSVQPSELARVATIVAVGAWMARAGDRVTEYRRGVAAPFALAAVPAVLVLIEPDFGSSVVLLFMGVLALWVGGARVAHLGMTFAGAMVALSVYGWSRLGHLPARVAGFSDPEKGSQVWQGMVALGHGGLAGTGLGQGVGKWGFVPEADSDFILAVLGEELGLVGSVLIVVLYGLFLWHGLRLVLGLRSRFGLVVGTGLLMQVLVQAILNMAVVTALAPPKGLPLPFVSSGGTSLLVLCVSTGMLLGLTLRPEEDPVRDARWATSLSRRGTPAP